MKNIIKHIIATSKKKKIKAKEVFHNFIEMTYQMNLTMGYEIKYNELKEEHFEFARLMIIAIKESPFTDILGAVLMNVTKFEQSDLVKSSQVNILDNVLTKAVNFDKKKLVKPAALLKLSALKKANNREKTDVKTYKNNACGTGSFVLVNVAGFMRSEAQQMDIYLNDTDEKLLKVAVVQLQLNELIHNQNQAKIINITAVSGNRKNLICHSNINSITQPFVKKALEEADKSSKFKELTNVVGMIQEQFKAAA